MQLVGFTVKNYRSIKSASKLRLQQNMVLIGPNNEGKSNLLRALVTSLELMGRYDFIRSKDGKEVTYIRSNSRIFDWETDFPISLQGEQPKGITSFELEFKLDKDEIQIFRQEIGSALNGTLPILLTVNQEGIGTFKVVKRGKGGNVLSKKAHKIGKFIKSRLQFEYIPAIRTADAAINVIENLIGEELSKLELNSEYAEALNKILELQRPVLKKISSSITSTLNEFLPNVKSLELNISEKAYRRSAEVIVDDGTPTLLENKGDGVKSLAALSLLKYSSQESAGKKQLILAIEEPESHLHPKAIHRLKEVIEEIGLKHQIIISSHCPLFVERTDVKRNIIVVDNKAKHANNISEIRNVLGVKSADNLINARVILIVEGEDDKESLISLISELKPDLDIFLKNGDFAIDSLGGASNLSYKVSLYKNLICLTHVFLDSDSQGTSALTVARSEGFVGDSDFHVTSCQGMKESEFEDLLDVTIYAERVRNEIGINLNCADFKNVKKKWSERIRDCYIKQGKIFNDSEKIKIKKIVCDQVKKNPDIAINSNKIDVINSLFEDLLKKLRAKK